MEQPTQTTNRGTEDILCKFCQSPSSVFSNEDGTYDCTKCHAKYFPILMPGVKAKRMVIQDWSKAHAETPGAMGCRIVFGQQGDISELSAYRILQKEDRSNSTAVEGFNHLSEQFSQHLWYSAGNAKIDDETIRDVCRKFAFSYIGKTDDGILSAEKQIDESIIRVSFPRKIVSSLDIKRLQENHELISSIPKSNDNLIRYFVAEGQEKLIAQAAHKAYQSFAARKNPCELGAELCKAICQ